MNHGTFSAYNKGCRCDECAARKRTSWKNYYANNREAWLEKGRREREADPEFIKRWRARNLAKQREYSRRFRERHPETNDAKNKRWLKTERGRVHMVAMQQMRRGAALTIEGRDYAVIIRQDPCSYCGSPATDLDHITPIRKGGDGHWPNLTPACRSCNARKGTKSLLTFLRERAAA